MASMTAGIRSLGHRLSRRHAPIVSHSGTGGSNPPLIWEQHGFGSTMHDRRKRTPKEISVDGPCHWEADSSIETSRYSGSSDHRATQAKLARFPDPDPVQRQREYFARHVTLPDVKDKAHNQFPRPCLFWA